MTPRRSPVESDYTRAILKRSLIAFQSVSLFRRNAGKLSKSYKGKEYYIKVGIAGQADLYAIKDGGAHYEIEIKRGTKLNPNQERWREWCVNRGIPWALLDVHEGELPAQTVERWVKELARFFGMGGER